MAIYGQFNNYRGPQQDAQAEYAQVHIANNGNPNGANNTAPTSHKPGQGNAPAPLNPQSFMSDYAIRQGGQRPELARYVAPQLDLAGNPVERDRGGYSYNAPNSFGNGGVNARFRPFGRSHFNPFSQQPGGGGMQGIMAQIRQRLQQEPTGMPRFGNQPRGGMPLSPGSGNNMGIMPVDPRMPDGSSWNDIPREEQLRRNEEYWQSRGGRPQDPFAALFGGQPQSGPGTMQPFNSGYGPPAPVPPIPAQFKPGQFGPPSTNPGFRDPVNNPVPGGI